MHFTYRLLVIIEWNSIYSMGFMIYSFSFSFPPVACLTLKLGLFFFPHLSLTCFLTKCLGFVFFFFSFSFCLSLLPQSLASMTSTQVKVNRALSVPPATFDLPLAANHRASVTIAPPSAHIGTAPVQMRLISYDLREGQVLESLFSPYYSGILENSIKSL